MTIEDIKYWNIATDRRDSFVKAMKSDFIDLNMPVILSALDFAQNTEDCTGIIVKKHPAHGDADFTWRVYPSEYRLYIYYGVSEERSFNLKKTGNKK